MKKHCFLFLTTIIIYLLVSSNLFGQFELVKDSLDHPTAIAFHKDKAYVTLQGKFPHTGQIISFDINNPSASHIVHMDSLSEYPRSITVWNDNLYIGFTTYIGKVNLDQSSFEIEEFISDVFFPRCLIVDNDRLYIAEDDKISFVDLTSQNADKAILQSGIAQSPLSLAIKNNYLYYASENDVDRIDLTVSPSVIENVYTDFDYNIYAISIIGNELYFDQTFQNMGSRAIMKFNLLDPTNTVETVASGIGSAIHLNHENGNMYFVSPLEADDGQEGKIFKFSEPIVTSTKMVVPNSFVIYPNPSRASIAIKGVPNQSVSLTLFDENGRFIKRTFDESQMDIIELNNGMYFLEIRDDSKNLLSKSKVLKIN